MFRHKLCKFVVAAALVAAGHVSLTASAQAAPHPAISGFWELHYDMQNIPPAALLPAAVRKKPAIEKQDAYIRRFCDNVGTPALMFVGPALDIRQDETEVAMLAPVNSTARHVYTDGRPHVNADIFDPTMNGDSIGKWVGNKLIVDTVGFDDRGLVALPGGGYRTSTSHLVESFELVNDGKELEVISTWTDPRVFARPYTYLVRYTRAPVGYRAEEWFCDAKDNNRAKALIDPPTPVVWPK